MSSENEAPHLDALAVADGLLDTAKLRASEAIEPRARGVMTNLPRRIYRDPAPWWREWLGTAVIAVVTIIVLWRLP